jgi:very-short-patch-repair endonuclease
MILDKKHYTKAERIFGRMLQEAHIPFKTKIKIQSREVDFIIGRYAIDIDGHEQDTSKNEMLVIAGYIPIHLNNSEITKPNKLNVNQFSRRRV